MVNWAYGGGQRMEYKAFKVEIDSSGTKIVGPNSSIVDK